MYRNLWQRTQYVASTYTGTFIVIMLLNQLLFFGFCLNPICLIAAMPHVLFITAIVGSWINNLKSWGAGDPEDADRRENKVYPVRVKNAANNFSDKIVNTLDVGTVTLEGVNNKLNVFNTTFSAKSEYRSERWFIETILKVSKQKLEVNERKRDSSFAKIYDEIEREFLDHRDAQSEEATPKVRSVANFALRADVVGSSNELEIKLAVAEVVAEHKNFLEQTKRELDRSPALMGIFEVFMLERGGKRVLAHLKQITPDVIPGKTLTSNLAGEIDARRSDPITKPLVQAAPVKHRKKRTDTGLYGSISRELIGNWTGGYYCGLHTMESKCLGEDEYGNPTWDTKRTEMGHQIYQLKYKNDHAAIPKIIDLVNRQITVEGFDYIIPVPASKIRSRQPVDEIAQAFGARIDVPVLTGFLRKSSTEELKEMDSPEERERLLKESIDIARTEDISAMNVLLLDDLYRSGATLRACCDLLTKKANVGEVWVLTMTKTRCLQ